MPVNQVQDLYYDVTGQTFDFVAPSRPSSITSVTVFEWDAGDDDTEEDATTGSASIENVNTSFDAASGKSETNPKLCHLTATTNIEQGRQYLATTAQGTTEWVEVVAINSGATITARTPLHNDFAASDTFVSTKASISVKDAWIQDDDHISNLTDPNPGYRIKWVWVDADSVTHVDFTSADVVRYRGSDYGVTPADMEQFHPGWQRMLPRDQQVDVGQSIIDAAFERVQDDLFALGVPDQMVRNRDMLSRVVRYAAVRQLHYAIYLGGGEIDRFEAADREYQALFDKLFRVTTKVAVATTSGGAGDKVSLGGVWSR